MLVINILLLIKNFFFLKSIYFCQNTCEKLDSKNFGAAI